MSGKMGKNTEEFCLMKKVGMLFLVAKRLVFSVSAYVLVQLVACLWTVAEILKFQGFQEFSKLKCVSGHFEQLWRSKIYFLAISKQIFSTFFFTFYDHKNGSSSSNKRIGHIV